MSVNKVILLGNVGRDPDVRYPSQGQIVATFPLATSDRAYRTQAGTQVPERTEWHNIVMWGRNAEVAEKYVKKGNRLYIEGRLPKSTSTLLRCLAVDNGKTSSRTIFKTTPPFNKFKSPLPHHNPSKTCRTLLPTGRKYRSNHNEAIKT